MRVVTMEPADSPKHLCLGFTTPAALRYSSGQLAGFAQVGKGPALPASSLLHLPYITNLINYHHPPRQTCRLPYASGCRQAWPRPVQPRAGSHPLKAQPVGNCVLPTHTVKRHHSETSAGHSSPARLFGTAGRLHHSNPSSKLA